MAEHEGPCLNYEGQKPEHYDQYDSCYLHIEASQRERAEMVDIIRAVADCEPMVYRDDDFGDDYVCGFCDVVADAVSRNDEWADVEHQDSCPWRRAREWADGHVLVMAPAEGSAI